ncbi:MAG: hypothetical protein KKB51_25115 [Candidatus Riflebacteria bacterium]|nr:hypothetical protein [Candidatus Riflebacteria bacterium]
MESKNIQIIDGARNCTYSIFSTSSEYFDLIFPNLQDVEFIDDFVGRVTEPIAQEILNKLWKNPVDKKHISGIHGTLFFGLEFKKAYYPTKKENEMIVAFD